MTEQVAKTPRVAVVTGASSGIGRELAIRLARAGFEPLLVARRADKLKETAAAVEAAGGKAHLMATDVNAARAADDVLAVAASAGTPEVLVNNAGFATYGAFAGQDRAENLRMLDTNVRALTDFTAAFLPGMLGRRSGYVLNVASTAGFQAIPWNAAYAASKAYVLSLGESLAFELKGTGVSCTTLCPGPTLSEFWKVGGYKEKGLELPGALMMSAGKVADLGVRGMLRRKPVVVTGLSNQAGAVGGRLVPRSVLRFFLGTLAKPKDSG
jgi:uncharacterized protein